MADVPDYRNPSPDAGHEAIRAPLAKAIDDLAATVADLGTTKTELNDTKTRGNQNKAGVDDAYFLTDLLFDLLGSALEAIAELDARISELEPPVFNDSPEEPTSAD